MSSAIHRSYRLLLISAALLPAMTRADTLIEQWSIAPWPDGPSLYITTANLERGIAYNPASGNVLLLGRAEGPLVYVLNADDGSDGSETLGIPRTLRLDDENGEFPISGGTFTMNLVGAAEDGAVYACSLATTLGTVRLYRWADDDLNTPVSVAYSGDPLEGIADPGSGQDIRFGDNFAVRGTGTDTQLLQTSRNGKYVILYTTSDGTSFTPRVLAAPALQGKAGLGLAFGAGNTFWTKLNGQELQHAEWDLTTGEVRVIGTVPTAIVAANVTGIGLDPVNQRLAAVNYTDHTLSVFDISDPSGLIPIGEALPFPTANGNANGTGAAAILGDRVFGLDTNNGLLAARIEESVVIDPPVIATQPAATTVYAGATFSLSVTAQGTPPFEYQWSLNEVPIDGATSAQLTLADVTAAQAGAYTVEVRNGAGSALSDPATVTIREPLNRGILRPLWSLNPGDRPYLTADNTQRGLAYNPATGNLLVASRTPGNAIAVLEATTGAERHTLRTTTADDSPLFVGGTLPLNQIAVAEDGAVFAANLVTDASSGGFRLYRWDNDSAGAIPAQLSDVFELSLPERWGDTMDIRGGGATTQILLGTRGTGGQEGRKFAVLSTADGFEFSAQVFLVEAVPANAFGLGIAFGPGNSVFGTAGGQPIIHAAFDPINGTATLARTYGTDLAPDAIAFLGSQPSSNLLAGVALETPDNVLLFDLTDLDGPAVLDQRLILPEQTNANGTGAIDFGADKVFVLDTNHGLRAFEIDREGGATPPALAIARDGANVQVTWTGSLESAEAIGGPWSPVTGASSPATLPATGAARYFRARE